MAVPYIFSTVAGGTSIPLSELDENFNYLAVSPSLTSLSLTGNITVGGISTFAGLISANGGLSLTGALTLNGAVGSNNQVVYSNSGVPSWTFIRPNMLTTGAPSWDATGNLTAIGDIISGTGTFKSSLAPLSQISIGTNNFSINLNSTNYFNVTSSLTTVPTNLLVTGLSSTFNNIVNAIGGLSLSGSFNVNGSTGSSNNVLLISGATPTWGRVSPSYLTAGGPAWDSSGNVSATLGIGSGTGTFYNTASANCNLAITPTGAITSVNGSSVFSVNNLGNATVLNNLTVGGAQTVNGNFLTFGDITTSATVIGSVVSSSSGQFRNSTNTQNGLNLLDTNASLFVNGVNTIFSTNVGTAITGFVGSSTGQFTNTTNSQNALNLTNTNASLFVNGVNTIFSTNVGTVITGFVGSTNGLFRNSTNQQNGLNLLDTNATLIVNGVTTLFSTNVGTAITGFVSSSTGNFINSSSSATSQLSVNTTAFTATVNGVAVSQILANGNMTITGLLTQLSDKSLKTNIENISKSDAIEKVRKLQGVLYNMKADPDGPKYLGLIADDVEKVVPEVIIEADISAEQDGSRKVKSLAYANLVSLLIEAVKEIDDRLTAKGI
jgi:hypothetical protein